MNEPAADTGKKGGKLKWILMCGCLAAALLCVGSSAAFVFGIMGAMKSSDAYKGAMTQARSSAAVTEALGTPLSDGALVSGNINVTNDTGSANLTVPLSGPKGEGTLHLVATKSAGKWTYSVLRVDVAGGQSLDLLVPEQDDGG